jgi:hypothetical protein
MSKKPQRFSHPSKLASEKAMTGTTQRGQPDRRPALTDIASIEEDLTVVVPTAVRRQVAWLGGAKNGVECYARPIGPIPRVVLLPKCGDPPWKGCAEAFEGQAAEPWEANQPHMRWPRDYLATIWTVRIWKTSCKFRLPRVAQAVGILPQAVGAAVIFRAVDDIVEVFSVEHFREELKPILALSEHDLESWKSEFFDRRPPPGQPANSE